MVIKRSVVIPQDTPGHHKTHQVSPRHTRTFQGGIFWWIFYLVLAMPLYASVYICLVITQLVFRLWCLTVSLLLSHWYTGSGVVLDCIDSWSLHPYLLWWPVESISSFILSFRTTTSHVSCDLLRLFCPVPLFGGTYLCCNLCDQDTYVPTIPTLRAWEIKSHLHFMVPSHIRTGLTQENVQTRLKNCWLGHKASTQNQIISYLE